MGTFQDDDHRRVGMTSKGAAQVLRKQINKNYLPPVPVPLVSKNKQGSYPPCLRKQCIAFFWLNIFLTYVPVDPHKTPDLIDFLITKDMSELFTHLESAISFPCL